ncbi:DUF4254 domain-containing protein [Candidatus Margulisiibacteriota bacterium]
MAETLGGLIDKLTIKNIRQWHLKNEATKLTATQINQALKIIRSQINDLTDEINDFIKNAIKGKVRVREQKLKLYKNPKEELTLNEIGPLVALLSRENLYIWQLEDHVRREGLPDSEIVKAKRKIDAANQKRNDLIDRIDELLEKKLKK